MSDAQFTILFLMALVFMIANDYIAFLTWYVIYSESLTTTWMTWDQWTIIFMVFYIMIRILAARFGWNPKGHFIGGDK